MSYSSRERDARFVRALVRSASGDASRAGAAARAGARLGVGSASAASFGLLGAVVLAAVTFATGWSPHFDSGDTTSGPTVSAADSSEDCRGGVEAPRWPCSEASRSAGSSGAMSGSSSGVEYPSRGGSGG